MVLSLVMDSPSIDPKQYQIVSLGDPHPLTSRPVILPSDLAMAKAAVPTAGIETKAKSQTVNLNGDRMARYVGRAWGGGERKDIWPRSHLRGEREGERRYQGERDGGKGGERREKERGG